ncbi:hypothetical protein DH2020_049706 [Rehmannia glutinosa]|uniref:Polysaccharide biosynthesis domain-containing protein n=1 Tax=Rehmannia glutinosa TaxID=99300 RepID=A0ABR0U288_REHGL
MLKVLNENQYLKLEKPCILGLLVVGLIGGASLIALSTTTTPYSSPLICGGAWGKHTAKKPTTTTLQLEAILHYATSRVVPQQSLGEITVTFDVLKLIAPCDFLVFGLGHDSLMWAALNPRGTTLFLEEDPKWFKAVMKDAPALHAETVPYRTQLSEADELLRHYRTEPDCWANSSFLRGNSKCRLALNMLSDKVYVTEWDMIMIDAPRGYFPKAPGRMAAIYSAAVMARNRKRLGVTHVFLHDVDRRVEKMYADMFLCKKYLVKAVGGYGISRSRLRLTPSPQMGPIVLAPLATGLSVLAGAVIVKQVMDLGSMMGSGRAPRCPRCNGSGRTTCLCTRWSDSDVGCRTCAGSGRMACSSCGGSGTGRPIPVRISATPPNQPS